MTASRTTLSILGVGVVLLLSSKAAQAHDGPPYPLLVDQTVGPCIVSVWTDPDVGTATFFVVANPIAGQTLPDDLKFQISVQPASGRLPEVTYPADRQSVQGQDQFKSLVQFDAAEMWKVRIKLASSRGSGELETQVEATPSGFGRWDLLIYLAPFLAVAFLWFKAFMRKRSRTVQN